MWSQATAASYRHRSIFGVIESLLKRETVDCSAGLKAISLDRGAYRRTCMNKRRVVAFTSMLPQLHLSPAAICCIQLQMFEERIA